MEARAAIRKRLYSSRIRSCVSTTTSALITSRAAERQITIALAFSGKYLRASFLCRASWGSIRRRRLARTASRVRFALPPTSYPGYYTCSRGKKLRINISLSGIRKLSRLQPTTSLPVLSSRIPKKRLIVARPFV